MEFINKLLHRGSASPVANEATNNAQPGKTEHEVKVQFAREFVDVGAPNSRPESLSSASSFQSLASTLSTKSIVQSSPITPRRAADTSYTDSDIPGLDELIAACGKIQLNDKYDPNDTEVIHPVADGLSKITAGDNLIQVPNAVQNLSEEEAFSSVINDSICLNGTHDLTSDYKEAFENSINLNDTREIKLEDKLQNSNSEKVIDFLPKQTDDNLITNIANHIQDLPDIPQSSVDNCLIIESRDLSLKNDIVNGFSLNKTLDLGSASIQPSNNLLQVQNSPPRSDPCEQPHALGETDEIVANCNTTFDAPNLSKSDVLNQIHDGSDDKKNLSIDCKSLNATGTRIDRSLNDLSASEADGNFFSLENVLNLLPESDANISTSNIQTFDTQDSVVTEPSKVNATLNTTFEPAVVKSVEAESVRALVVEKSVQEALIVPDQCIPDSSTDHLPEEILEFVNQVETATSTGITDIYQNISEKVSKDNLSYKEDQQISNNHDVSTTEIFSIDNIKSEPNFEEQESAQSQEIPATQEFVESHGLNSTQSELESKKTIELPSENPVNQSPGTLKQLENPEPVLPVPENIVPCFVPQNSLNNTQELGKSKSEELPEIVINVTPFPIHDSKINQTSILNVQEDSRKEDSSGEQDSNDTITLREESLHSIGSEAASETYNAFQPTKQSTSLTSECNFKKLEIAAQGVAEEIRNKSLEFSEDSDQFFSAEPDLFLDTASFDFFLTRNNNKNSVRDLRAESLYVKFDPLVSNVSMLPQGPPQVVEGDENAKNSIPQPTLDTPKRNPALAAIDRLLFYSPATGTPNKVEDPPKIEEKIVKSEMPAAVPIVDETMAKELELVRSTVLQLDSQLEKQRKEHEAEVEKQRLKYKELEMELMREVQKKNEMTMVMDEYEKSLSRHMADSERERASFEQEKAKLQEELQAANHHLGNTEAAFNDVHSKYERLKIVVAAYKSNEDVLKESVQENVETIKTLEARYEQLKSHAMTQLEKANLELEAIRKQHETETVKLQAMIRKAELKSNSLAEMVEQKSKENKELAEILDEFIARVGRNPE